MVREDEHIRFFQGLSIVTPLSVVLWGIIIWVMLMFSGCGNRVYTPVCRHTALLAAVVVSESYSDVRVDFGPTETASWHAQAKVKVGGEWVWLKEVNGRVYFGDKEKFTNLNSYTLKDYISFMGWGK